MNSRNTYYFFYGVLFSAISVFGQQKVVDSLRQQLRTTETLEEKAKLFGDMAKAFINTQVYNDSSYFYNNKSYEIALDIENSELEGRALFNFGMIYNNLGDYDLSLSYYLKALPFYEGTSNYINQSIINSSVAALYYNKEEYQKSKIYFEKAIRFSEIEEDAVGLLIDYVNLSEVTYMLNDFPKAKEHIEHALSISKKTAVEFPQIYIIHGTILFQFDSLVRSKEEALKGIKMAKEDSDISSVVEASNLLYKIASKSKNYKEAIAYLETYKKYDDSLNRAKELNEIEKLKLNFELKKKEETLTYMSQQNKYQYIIYGLGFTGLGLLVLLVFRQLKISRMTEDMHKIQKSLVAAELKQRTSQKEGVKNATGFEATLEQDKELF